MSQTREVTLSTKVDLTKALESLKKFRESADEVLHAFEKAGNETTESFNQNNKKVEGFLGKMRSVSRRIADQLRGDFKALLSLNALGGAMKLSSQFAGSIKQTVNLSDAIRKLGGTFGIAQKDFSRFQTLLTKGLGEIGLNSDVAASALEGLSQTPVRGEGNLLEYSKTAGMLASVGREKGKEGDIAMNLARVTQARGGNVNDPAQMKQLAQAVLAARTATGAAPSEILSNMERMFTTMSADFRKKLDPKALATIAGAANVAGPNATAFVEKYLSMSKVQRAGLEARGMGNLFGKEGFNPDQIKKFYAEAQRLGSGDIRLGLKAMGIESDEAAEGFTRLVDQLDGVVAAQRRIQASNADLTDTYRKSMGMGEAFEASINRVKKMVAGPLSSMSQGLTDMLGGAAQSDMGSAGVVAGGGILAALLAGGGMRGMGSTMLKGAAAEQLTGQKTIPVYVTNASEIGGGLGGAAAAGSGMLGKAGGMLGKIGMVGAAGAVGYEVGGLANQLIDTHTQGTTKEGFSGNIVEQLFFKLDKLIGGDKAAAIMNAQKVTVAFDAPGLKEVKSSSRGASH